MKDWNDNPILLGSWVLYVQNDILRIGRVLGFEHEKVVVQWVKSKTGYLPTKPGRVLPSNLTVMGWSYYEQRYQ